MTELNTQAERVAFAIAQTGKKQTEIADLVGVTRAAVSLWVKGKGEVRAEHIFKVADLSGLNARWLATGEGPRQKGDCDERTQRLVEIYAKLDEDGKRSVYRVAEAESAYALGDINKRKTAA